MSRVNDVFSHDSIAASVGLGYRPAARLVEVWKAADDAMYLAKRGREPRHVRAS
jgi:phosphotransferase system HPr-like phosphotransfer protein